MTQAPVSTGKLRLDSLTILPPVRADGAEDAPRLVDR